MSKNHKIGGLTKPKHNPLTYRALFVCGVLLYVPVFVLIRVSNALHQPRTRAVIVYKSHVLLVRNSIGFQKQTLPGGGLHKNEPEISGLLRELKEELSIDVQESQCRFLCTFKASDIEESSDKITYFIELTKKQYKSLSLSLELLSAAWVPIGQLSHQKDLLVKKASITLASLDLTQPVA